MSASKIFPSANAIFAIGRQTGQGNVRTQNLYKLLATQFQPKHASNMSSLGIEVGGNTISEQRSQKESFMPDVSYQGHLRVGAMLNILCACGYMPLSVGIDPGSPTTTTLNAVVSSRHAKAVTLASISGISVGDWLQIGALVTPGTPVVSDTCEVHEVVSVGSTNAVQKITVNATGGTFTISYGGQTTAALASNISTASLQTALEGLSSIGSGNISVTGTAGSSYTLTFQGTLAATNVALATVDGTNLTGSGAYGAVTETTAGAGAAQVAFKGRLLYTYANGTAVKKVDSTKAVTHYFLHIQPDNPLEGDLWTVYFRIANSDTVVAGLMQDVASSGFSPNFNVGNIATVSGDLKALDVNRAFGKLYEAFATLQADPSNVSLNNTRGTFSLLGNTVDAPRQMGFTLNAELYDDVVLTKYQKQSNVHIGHTLAATSEGKFVKDFFDQIIYGGANNVAVDDSIPESSLVFTAQSAKTVSTGVPYSFGLNAPDCQFAGYDPQLNTNQPASANMETIKVVQNATTGAESHYFTSVSRATTDCYSAV